MRKRGVKTHLQGDLQRQVVRFHLSKITAINNYQQLSATINHGFHHPVSLSTSTSASTVVLIGPGHFLFDP